MHCSAPRSESHGHPLDAGHHGGPHPVDVADKLEIGIAAQQHLEEDASLEPGQLGSDARMLAAAERDVRVGMSSDVEVLGVGAEDLLVAVGGAVEHDDRVARVNELPADLDVGGRGPRHVRHRSGPAQHLLDRCRDQRGVVDKLPALVRVVDEGQRAERDQVAGGLIARHQQQEGEIQQVVVGELLAVDLGAGQDRQHVVSRHAARLAAMSWMKYS